MKPRNPVAGNSWKYNKPKVIPLNKLYKRKPKWKKSETNYFNT